MFDEISPSNQTSLTSEVLNYCIICDESFSSRTLYCTTCGSQVNPRVINAINSTSSPGNVTDNNLESILRNIFEESINSIKPSRQISQDYLKNLGKIILDKNRGILHDSFIDIGPLRLLAVPASFNSICPPITLEGEFVWGMPRFGESEFQNDIKGKIVITERGKVSFAKKLLHAQNSGAIALLVTQTVPLWPFVMTDSSEDLNNLSNILPAFMISQESSNLIDKLIQIKTLKGTIKVNIGDTVCSICQEEMVLADEVLKLNCRHIYHSTCVMSWLESHNTCPLCRVEMPKEDDKYNNENYLSTENFYDMLFG